MGPSRRKSTVLTPLWRPRSLRSAFRAACRSTTSSASSSRRSRPSPTAVFTAACNATTSRVCPTREPKGRFKYYDIGYFHLDVCEVMAGQGKAQMFVAMERTSKIAFAKLYRRATTVTAAAFIRALVKEVPYRIHTVS